MQLKYGKYSTSKINLYKKCPKAFKFRYIEKIKISSPQLALQKGDLLHKSIEHCIVDQPFNIKNEAKKYTEITQDNIIEYVNIIEKFKQFKIFNTLKKSKFKKYIETWFYLNMNLVPCEYSNAIISGKIDLFSIDSDKRIGIIIDWKTGGKSIENIELYGMDSSQLELYSIWLLQKYNLNAVKSKFFFIEFDKELSNIYTQKDIKNIQEKLMADISIIENTNDFCSNISTLCHWCEYADICTSWK